MRFVKKSYDQAPEHTKQILKNCITGNLQGFEKSVRDSGITASELFLVRGLQVKTYDSNTRKMIQTKTWNVLLFAIHFRHLQIVKYLVEMAQINLRMMMEEPRTSDEIQVHKSDPIFGYLLVIRRKDFKMFEFLLESCDFYLTLTEVM